MPARRKGKGKKGAGGAAGGGGAGQPAAATPLGASAASAQAAAERLYEDTAAETVTPQCVAAAAAALATLGSPTSSISYAHVCLGDPRSAAEWSAKAADAAARFPDAVPPYAAARCFNLHAGRLAATGRDADAAGWVARAHPLWLRSASDPGFRAHLLT
eukprot:gene3312-665_t